MRPYDKTTYDDKTVDWLTRAALEDTAKRLGYDLTILQGSYDAGGVSASAGTHDGGGAVDLSPWDADRKVLEMRRTGFAAWHRPPIPGVWEEHIHCILMGDAKASPAAKQQMVEYMNGLDGLADNGPDNGPRQFIHNRYRWQRGSKQIGHAGRLIEKARLLLATGIRGYRVKDSRKALAAAAAQLPKVGP